MPRASTSSVWWFKVGGGMRVTNPNRQRRSRPCRTRQLHTFPLVARSVRCFQTRACVSVPWDGPVYSIPLAWRTKRSQSVLLWLGPHRGDLVTHGFVSGWEEGDHGSWSNVSPELGGSGWEELGWDGEGRDGRCPTLVLVLRGVSRPSFFVFLFCSLSVSFTEYSSLNWSLCVVSMRMGSGYVAG